jgi:glycosyltransferase involved in cell wall biosynthesis
VHGVDPSRVVAIPHGAAANFQGARLDVPHPCILTWGLLGPGKGIEHVIRALAHLHAPPTYIVAGRTHPKVLANEGERYREELQRLARELGVAGNVVFDDGYRDWPSLRALVRSADVVVLPYDSADQVSSGVLVEALAAGRPVVATPFPHAEELLAGGAGILVDHHDPIGLAGAIDAVLAHDRVARAMRAEARRAAAPLLWPSVGRAYLDLLQHVLAGRVAA